MARLVASASIMLVLTALSLTTPQAAATSCHYPVDISSTCQSLFNAADVPDFCADRGGDTWERTYEVNPDKDGLMLVGADVSELINDLNEILQGGRDGEGVALLKAGEFSYYADIWKCTDTDKVDNFWYYGWKHGYVGTGTGWTYNDGFSFQEVDCYSAPEVDAGQLPCEAWANSPPVYSTYTISVTIGGKPVEGAVTWDTLLIPEAGGVAWIGDFEGKTQDLLGLPVSAKFVAYL